MQILQRLLKNKSVIKIFLLNEKKRHVFYLKPDFRNWNMYKLNYGNKLSFVYLLQSDYSQIFLLQ